MLPGIKNSNRIVALSPLPLTKGTSVKKRGKANKDSTFMRMDSYSRDKQTINNSSCSKSATRGNIQIDAQLTNWLIPYYQSVKY